MNNISKVSVPALISEKELRKEYDRLRKENNMLKMIIDNTREAIIAVNEHDEIILYNTEAERIEDMHREDVLGKKEDDVYVQPFYFSDEVVKKVIRTGKPIIEQPYWYYLHDGRKTNMIFSVYPYFHEHKIAGAYIIFRNLKQISDFIAMTLEMQKKFHRDEKNSPAGTKFLLDDIIGGSSIAKLKKLSREVAHRSSSVLIVGETGTGKELFAQGIHNASLYANGPYVPINCAAIPETLLESLLFGTVKGAFTGSTESPGLFEQAKDGTIFLDEINSMSMHLQAKLLRVLQDKAVRRVGGNTEIPLNCRIISAANQSPVEAVEKGALRPDLFYRLATVTINIPPLRERCEDIPLLVMHFMRKYNHEFGLFLDNIDKDLLRSFCNYHWPGNVRELENFVEGAMNFVSRDEKTLKLKHLPEYYQDRLALADYRNTISAPKVLPKGTLQNFLTDTERQVIESILEHNQGNISKTAKQLGISRQNLYYKLQTLGLR